MPLTEHQDGSVTLSVGRANICHDAAWEAEELARLLPGLMPDIDADTLRYVYRIRSVAGRLKELALIIGSGLCDEVERDANLYRRLYLVSPPDDFDSSGTAPRRDAP